MELKNLQRFSQDSRVYRMPQSSKNEVIENRTKLLASLRIIYTLITYFDRNYSKDTIRSIARVMRTPFVRKHR